MCYYMFQAVQTLTTLSIYLNHHVCGLNARIKYVHCKQTRIHKFKKTMQQYTSTVQQSSCTLNSSPLYFFYLLHFLLLFLSPPPPPPPFFFFFLAQGCQKNRTGKSLNCTVSLTYLLRCRNWATIINCISLSVPWYVRHTHKNEMSFIIIIITNLITHHNCMWLK